MSEETVSLKEHLETLIGELDRRFTDLRNADQQAVKTANIAFEKRMDGANEWRGALDDNTRRLATIQQFDALKEQFQVQIDNLAGRITSVERAQASIKDKSSGAGQLWAMLAAVVVAVGVIVGIMVSLLPARAG